MRHGSSASTNRGANGGRCRLPAGRTWRSHCGGQQRERLLRQRWARIERMGARCPGARAARERLLDAVADEPAPEFAALQLGHSALIRAEEQRTSWAVAMNAVLDEIEATAAARTGDPDDGLGVGADGMPPNLRAAIARDASAP
jgi:hypothetical protein